LGKYVKKHSVPVIVNNFSTDHRFDVQRQKFRSAIAVPLEVNNTVIGMLECTAREEDVFDQGDLRLLSIIGGIASLALNNVNLYKKTQELAITDGLTGLYVQNYFKERLEEEVKMSKRHSLNLSVAIIDIDHFKRINDTYGHMVGDSVLRHLADILRHRFRETDFICRYGGEEFGVLMLQTDIKEALSVCEGIRKGTEEEKFFLPVESFKPVQEKLTISIGLAKLGVKITTGKALLEAADEALYEAKRNGRNRTEVSNL
jgi:diguanylate cyclase (GGDEF)-like protein